MANNRERRAGLPPLPSSSQSSSQDSFPDNPPLDLHRVRRGDKMSRSSSASSAASSIEFKIARASRSLFKLAGITEYQCAEPHCGTAEAVLRLCGNCRTVAYCSTECQNTHWPQHKPQCRVKNPNHFEKAAVREVQWLIDLTQARSTDNGNEYLTYLVDSFRLRCLEEEEQARVWPKPEEMMLKFIRFLHAAKGVGVLPKGFTKVDYISARYDAISRYKLPEQTPTRIRTEVKERYPAKTVDDLRTLHSIICGPIVSNGSEHPNII